MPHNMVPVWYIKNPVNRLKGAPGYLCLTCRHINFLELFKQQETDTMPRPRDYITLGTLQRMIMEHQGCGFCKLVGRIIALDTVKDLPLNMNEEERKVASHRLLLPKLKDAYSLCPVRFTTTYREPALYICSNKDILNASKQSIVLRPQRSMAMYNIGYVQMGEDKVIGRHADHEYEDDSIGRSV